MKVNIAFVPLRVLVSILFLTLNHERGGGEGQCQRRWEGGREGERVGGGEGGREYAIEELGGFHCGETNVKSVFLPGSFFDLFPNFCFLR